MATQTRSQEQIENDAQYQNPAPIGPQSPIPAGVHDMIVSWDRKEGWMSVRVPVSKIGGQGGGKSDWDRWWFKEMLGEVVVTGNDNAGRILISGKGSIHGEQLQLWRPSYAPQHPMVYGHRRDVTYNRLCYFRAEARANRPCWRLRDQHMDWNHPGALMLLKGYVGDWNIEWPQDDQIAHLFHQGFVMVCSPGCFLHEKGGYGHLYGADRWEESEGYVA